MSRTGPWSTSTKRRTAGSERGRALPPPGDATRLSRGGVAERAGVEHAYVGRLIDLGILAPEEDDRFTPGDVRRVLITRSFEDAGIPPEDLGTAIRRGALSLDFLDAAVYERVGHLAAESFRQVSDRTGIPLELLTVVREAVGMAPPSPDDRLREEEMPIVRFIELQLAAGFSSAGIEHLLRVHGDSTRRIAEAEAAWWNSEVVQPAMAAEGGSQGISNKELSDRLAPALERSILAMYHLHEARAWTGNIVEGFEGLMVKAGIRSRLERLPAICFFDITGYTMLTQERGDEEAANLATTVERLVQRCSVRRGGTTIKWLGDGVMFYFDEPGQGVRAALEMVSGVAEAGLPMGHVGVHAGPVLFQEGDYFGQTVNLTARIADFAQAGEVLVSRVVADASRDDGLVFDDVGPVTLKGVVGSVQLLRARLSPGRPDDGV